MDPLFERRELSKKVHIHSKFLQRNMQASVLAQLKMNVEGKCSTEGFVQRNSITIIKYSLGRTNYVKGGVDYDVSFQADICMPHEGQKFKVPVTVRSKVGIHAETPPLKILVPRDLHIGNADFENVKVGEDIECEVIGCQFRQQDVDIIVVAKLLSKVAPEIEHSLVSQEAVVEPIISIPVESDVKQIITMPENEEKPKKRKLKQKGGFIEENGKVLSFEARDA